MLDKIKHHFSDRNYTDMSVDTEIEMTLAFVGIPVLLFVIGLLAYLAYN